jgi:hypothetical protein
MVEGRASCFYLYTLMPGHIGHDLERRVVSLSAKRIFATAATAVVLTGLAAGPALADTSTAPGPGACFGPPGQPVAGGISLVDFAKEIGVPPGQIVSMCNLHGHGQTQDDGSGGL